MANVPRVKAETEAPGPPSGQKEAQTGRTREASDERELVCRAQTGDGDAYEVLVGRHQQRVLAVVRRVLRRSEDAEDVAQQVFIKAYFALRRFDQRAAFGTWLYKIAVNECWDYLRKKKVRPLLYDADLSEEQVSRLDGIASFERPPEGPSARVEAREALDQVL